MKSILTILVTTMVGIFLVAPVLAKNYKVPTSICWSYNDGGTYYITAGTKKGGWVRYGDAGKVSFYAVQGLENRDASNPMGWDMLSGTAAVNEGNNWLYMTLNSGWQNFYTFLIGWDLVNNEGGVYIQENASGDPLAYFDLTEVDCKTVMLDPGP